MNTEKFSKVSPFIFSKVFPIFAFLIALLCFSFVVDSKANNIYLGELDEEEVVSNFFPYFDNDDLQIVVSIYNTTSLRKYGYLFNLSDGRMVKKKIELHGKTTAIRDCLISNNKLFIAGSYTEHPETSLSAISSFIAEVKMNGIFIRYKFQKDKVSRILDIAENEKEIAVLNLTSGQNYRDTHRYFVYTIDKTNTDKTLSLYEINNNQEYRLHKIINTTGDKIHVLASKNKSIFTCVCSNTGLLCNNIKLSDNSSFVNMQSCDILTMENSPIWACFDNQHTLSYYKLSTIAGHIINRTRSHYSVRGNHLIILTETNINRTKKLQISVKRLREERSGLGSSDH